MSVLKPRKVKWPPRSHCFLAENHCWEPVIQVSRPFIQSFFPLQTFPSFHPCPFMRQIPCRPWLLHCGWEAREYMWQTCRCVIPAVPSSQATCSWTALDSIHFSPPPPDCPVQAPTSPPGPPLQPPDGPAASSHALRYKGSGGMVSQTNCILSLSYSRALRIKSKVYNKIYTTLPGLEPVTPSQPTRFIPLFWSLCTPVYQTSRPLSV